MKAAVVNNFEQVPQYQSFEKPQPQTKEQLIQVRAASVNHRVQSQAMVLIIRVMVSYHLSQGWTVWDNWLMADWHIL
ncbi:hypothetical protein [Paucilactobacillus hokkaidonensis]|uniref:hypothetical protein n=1 Tax=Paucilactobacillus hokkaidonensis TaxID=1193095 RepID=UPI0006D09AC3|nr:hypothetical protein [Paucilactobacillus hokkaidonensis]